MDRKTFLSRILAPFLATRLIWIIVAGFARATFLPNPTYAEYAQRGGHLTRFFLLDIFAHWDSKWYLAIAQSGYSLPAASSQPGNLATTYSTVAFFPLYPYLARGAGWLGITLPDSVYLITGLLISNLCFLGAMALLYRLATRHLHLSAEAAGRGLLLIFAFPASFYFSCFYTESLFLFFCVLTFTMALEARWAWAGAAAALAALTRSPGLFAAAAAAWIYMDCREWRFKAIRPDVLWLGLAPLALAAHLASLFPLTGDLLAPFTALSAWGRGQYGLFQGLWINLSGPGLDVFKIDALLGLVFLAAGVWMLFHYDSKVYGLFALALILMPLASGLVISLGRYLAVVFPVFLFFGEKLERKEPFNAVVLAGFALQMVFFAGWANFYWIE